MYASKNDKLDIFCRLFWPYFENFSFFLERLDSKERRYRTIRALITIVPPGKRKVQK